MKLKVNPNRMELMRLKKRLGLVRRGHKLLKDKQEDLMRRFWSMIKETQELRAVVEERLMQVYNAFLSARMEASVEIMDDALWRAKRQVEITVSQINILNLRLPQFQFEWDTCKPCPVNWHTSGDMDVSLNILKEIMPQLLDMASKEKCIQLISEELETTRRRVNALEHVLIPGICEAMSSIEQKLDEVERSNLARLMKVKEIVRK
ncbi:V-type ATP synthase subunit D [bacterium]|nr:V-type ATP synthase subunit D [bacterium]MBU1752304.1 V-type ATP synthase subunit D [bacterium]